MGGQPRLDGFAGPGPRLHRARRARTAKGRRRAARDDRPGAGRQGRPAPWPEGARRERRGRDSFRQFCAHPGQGHRVRAGARGRNRQSARGHSRPRAAGAAGEVSLRAWRQGLRGDLSRALRFSSRRMPLESSPVTPSHPHDWIRT